LPGLHPVRSDLPILSRLAGISYPELLGRIVEAAARRQGLLEQAGPWD
jgi:D-alanine-D-alanine ligase